MGFKKDQHISPHRSVYWVFALGLCILSLFSLSSCNNEEFYSKRLEVQGEFPPPNPNNNVGSGGEDPPPPTSPTGEEDRAPVPEVVTPSNGEEDREHMILLKYTDRDGDKASHCRIEGSSNLQVTTPCFCDPEGEQGSNCSVGLTGDLDYYGEVSFRYSVGAENLYSGPSPLVTYSLVNVADRPLATGGSLQGAAKEDRELRVHLGFLDVDGDPATGCQVSVLDGAQILDSSRCSCTDSKRTGYCVALLRTRADFFGSLQFDYTVSTSNSGLRSSGTGTSLPARVRLTVESVNDAPIAHNGNAGRREEGSSFQIGLSYTDRDSSAQKCEIRHSSAGKLTLASCSCDAISGACEVGVTGKAAAIGSTSFDFRVQDKVGQEWSNWATVSLELTEKMGLCGRQSPIQKVEEFVQSGTGGNKVDILWVIDNSGSMSGDQKLLAQTFNSFIDGFIRQKIDFQMGITTTSGYAGSDQSADFKKLNAKAAARNETQFKADFKRLVQVGSKGSNWEKGLAKSRSFLEGNRNWLRKKALLVVVYLSDEDDQSRRRSSDPRNKSHVEIFVDFLSGLKKEGAKMVQVYSIVNQEKDSVSSQNVGSRYIGVSRAFDPSEKTIASIKPPSSCGRRGTPAKVKIQCHAQYLSSVLSSFGGNILDLLDSFTLKGNPIAGSGIQVSVDGVSKGEGTAWDYDAFRKNIVFKDSFIPEESSRIRASYQECPSN